MKMIKAIGREQFLHQYGFHYMEEVEVDLREGKLTQQGSS